MIIEYGTHIRSTEYKAPYVDIKIEDLETVPQLDVDDINIENTGYDYQQIAGKIKSIKPPVDQQDEILYCPECDTYENNYDFKRDSAWYCDCGHLNPPNTTICGKCSTSLFESYMERKHARYYCQKCRTQTTYELYGSYITQQIIISNDNTFRELKVNLHVETPLTKNDIGKHIKIIGNIHFHEGRKEFYTETGNYTFDQPNETKEEHIETSRDIPGYEDWRKEVLQRDQKCIVCDGDKHLEAHHMYGYKQYPELRTDLNNGVTVCKFCHDKYHSYYGVKDITPLKFVKFMKRFGL